MRAAEGQIKRIASNLQQSLDGLRPQFEGQPIEQIKWAVAAAWSRVNDGARITDPELAEFSEAIRTGQGITIRYSGIKK